MAGLMLMCLLTQSIGSRYFRHNLRLAYKPQLVEALGLCPTEDVKRIAALQREIRRRDKFEAEELVYRGQE
jgi:hypothetical protein